MKRTTGLLLGLTVLLMVVASSSFADGMDAGTKAAAPSTSFNGTDGASNSGKASTSSAPKASFKGSYSEDPKKTGNAGSTPKTSFQGTDSASNTDGGVRAK